MIYYQSNSSHSQTPHYFPTKVVFSKHGLCLFWVGVFFFPQVCWSFLLQADLGSISAHMLIGSQWSIAKQHGCRCWCCTSEIWAAILVRSWSKQRPWPGHFSPSANQWASLSFMLKLIGWWHLDSLLVRYRSRSSIKMLTRCKIKNTSPQKNGCISAIFSIRGGSFVWVRYQLWWSQSTIPLVTSIISTLAVGDDDRLSHIIQIPACP